MEALDRRKLSNNRKGLNKMSYLIKYIMRIEN
jgi:hypothetical protein